MHDLGIDQFSAEHRLALIGEIWDSLSLDALPIPDAHRELLDQRIAAADREPAASRSWEEVRAVVRGEQ
jgi:putative addiction module component (TIGR02574 family)